MADDGIKIDGKPYRIPTSMRVGETRVIKRMTGLNPPEFMLALNALKDTQDPDVGAAMVWWIVHREDPSFTIDMVDELEWGAIEGDADDDPKAAGSPSVTASISSGSSGNSATTSNSTSEAPGETTPASGGVPDWALSGHAT